MDERRKSERVKVNIFVDEVIFEGEVFHLKAVVEDALFEFSKGDISEGGAFIPAQIEGLKKGSTISIRFTLPNSSRLHTAEGRVVWVKAGSPGFGVKFEHLEQETLSALRELSSGK